MGDGEVAGWAEDARLSLLDTADGPCMPRLRASLQGWGRMKPISAAIGRHTAGHRSPQAPKPHRHRSPDTRNLQESHATPRHRSTQARKHIC